MIIKLSGVFCLSSFIAFPRVKCLKKNFKIFIHRPRKWLPFFFLSFSEAESYFLEFLENLKEDHQSECIDAVLEILQKQDSEY